MVIMAMVWLLADHQGTIHDLVNNSGTVINHITYDSLGDVVSESNPTVTTRYMYTGREYDSETGLYYYRAKYYDAQVGRFIGEDPLSFGGGDSNLYRYVGNDAINKVDPLGLLVHGVFNRFSGDLKIYDVDNINKFATAKAFSGDNNPNSGGKISLGPKNPNRSLNLNYLLIKQVNGQSLLNLIMLKVLQRA